MSFQVRAELAYEVAAPSTLLLAIQVAATRGQTIVEESLELPPGVRAKFLLSPDGENRFVRLETDQIGPLALAYQAQVQIRPDVVQVADISQVEVADLPGAVLPYLFASRYCPSDLLGDFAHQNFGAVKHPLAQARAIADWIHREVRYETGSSTTATTALDTLDERRGVCRDFAHLGITLCRALSIPARYFSGYAWNLQPPDFHACFEVWADGHWFLFDPTGLSVPDGLVRIGTGRDAADTAVATLFGPVTLTRQRVSCESADFQTRWAELPADTAVRLEPEGVGVQRGDGDR